MAPSAKTLPLLRSQMILSARSVYPSRLTITLPFAVTVSVLESYSTTAASKSIWSLAFCAAAAECPVWANATDDTAPHPMKIGTSKKRDKKVRVAGMFIKTVQSFIAAIALGPPIIPFNAVFAINRGNLSPIFCFNPRVN